MKGRHQKVRRNLPGAGAWQPGNPVPRKNTGCRSPASLRGLHRGLRVDKRRRMCWWASRVDVSGKQVEGQGRGAKTAWAGGRGLGGIHVADSGRQHRGEDTKMPSGEEAPVWR